MTKQSTSKKQKTEPCDSYHKQKYGQALGQVSVEDQVQDDQQAERQGVKQKYI